MFMGGIVIKEEIFLSYVDLRLCRKEWCEDAALLLLHELLISSSLKCSFPFYDFNKEGHLVIVNHELEL